MGTTFVKRSLQYAQLDKCCEGDPRTQRYGRGLRGKGPVSQVLEELVTWKRVVWAGRRPEERDSEVTFGMVGGEVQQGVGDQ